MQECSLSFHSNIFRQILDKRRKLAQGASEKEGNGLELAEWQV